METRQQEEKVLVDKFFEVLDDSQTFYHNLEDAKKAAEGQKQWFLGVLAEQRNKGKDELIAMAQDPDFVTWAKSTGYVNMEGAEVETLDEGSKKLVEDLRDVLDEAVAGEFGDFTNDKYPAPKIALVEKFETLKQNVINGNYD